MTVEDFMANVPAPRRRSPLWNHQAAIIKLRKAGYPVRVIRQYLLEQGVDVKEARIHRFLTESLCLRKNARYAAHDATPPPAVPSRSNATAASSFFPKTSDETGGIAREQLEEFHQLARLGRKT